MVDYSMRLCFQDDAMSDIPYAIYSAEQSRQLDRLLLQQYRLSAAQLMVRAGEAALLTIKRHWPESRRILIVCGTGHNGGDGFELARQAWQDGLRVQVIVIGSASDTVATMRDNLIAAGVNVQPFTGVLPDVDIIVDAIVGIGLNRQITGEYEAVVAAINQAGLPAICLDIPSGINADTGRVMGVAVKATLTLSFISLNKGLFTGDGPDYVGNVHFAGLKTPSVAYDSFSPVARRLSLTDYRYQLASRQRIAHKGLYGHLLVIGGDRGMAGAPWLAAEAGARVGAGLTTIATRVLYGAGLVQSRPELMCYDITTKDDLMPLIKKATAITIGPGLGQSEWGQVLLQHAIASGLPMVVDADALNLLSRQQLKQDNWVLTPHVGEAARLLGLSTADIQADRFAAVAELQKHYGGVAVLKGAGTLVNNGESLTALSTSGNPGMSSGGMGDVLAGVIGGLVAQHIPLMDAACIGVIVHGMAGDKAAGQNGERGMLAMDLMPHLRHLVNLID